MLQLRAAELGSCVGHAIGVEVGILGIVQFPGQGVQEPD